MMAMIIWMMMVGTLMRATTLMMVMTLRSREMRVAMMTSDESNNTDDGDDTLRSREMRAVMMTSDESNDTDNGDDIEQRDESGDDDF